MSRDNDQTLVFIHGVGGASAVQEWLNPLSDVMARHGYSRPELSGVDIITIEYQTALLSAARTRLPKVSWRKPKDLTDHHANYQTQRAERDRVIRAFKQTPPDLGLGRASAKTADQIARQIERYLPALREE